MSAGVAAADAIGASVWSTTMLIRGIGLRLSLPSIVICTALALYHRFRTGEATAQLDSGLVAMAVIYLASKAEEVRLDTITYLLYLFCSFLSILISSSLLWVFDLSTSIRVGRVFVHFIISSIT